MLHEIGKGYPAQKAPRPALRAGRGKGHFQFNNQSQVTKSEPLKISNVVVPVEVVLDEVFWIQRTLSTFFLPPVWQPVSFLKMLSCDREICARDKRRVPG